MQKCLAHPLQGCSHGLLQWLLFAGCCQWEPGVLLTLVGDDVHLPRPLSTGSGSSWDAQDDACTAIPRLTPSCPPDH